MRVGLVLERFDPRQGGVEQWTRQFAQGLCGAGHEVHVVASEFHPSTAVLGFIPHLVPAPRSRLQRAAAAERMLRSLRLDVIHDMGSGWHCDVFQPHGGSRTAAFEQNLLLAPAWLRPWKRRLAGCFSRYREFDRLQARQYVDDGRIVLALSDMVQADLIRRHGVDPGRIRRIYNGVDADRFSPTHRGKYRDPIRRRLGLTDETLFLIVAHNHRLKGVPALIEAVQRLANQGHRVHAAVVGGKPPRSSRMWLEYATQAWNPAGWYPPGGPARHVTFVGSVDDPTPYYAAADVYVQPTFYDPCSLVALEALASGLPVVTTRFNGVAELMTDGRQGYVLDDPLDTSALCDRMRRLLDPELRLTLGASARHLALEQSFEANLTSVLSVYEEIAGSPRRPTDSPLLASV